MVSVAQKLVSFAAERPTVGPWTVVIVQLHLPQDATPSLHDAMSSMHVGVARKRWPFWFSELILWSLIDIISCSKTFF